MGRNATDPRLLVALWVYATLRALAPPANWTASVASQMAYRWLCGGVSVNYRMLLGFRSQGGEKWDELLTHIVAGCWTPTW